MCRLALSIYDDLSVLHGYGKQPRRLLAAAALLHDVGWSISATAHHKTGMAFIADDRTLPFSPWERVIVALCARYHRGSLPKQQHPLYRGLSKRDRRMVHLLAGIIRVADGLDRSHCGAVHVVHVKSSTGTLVFSCVGSGRGSAEWRTAAKKADMLMKVFSADVLICWKRMP